MAALSLGSWSTGESSSPVSEKKLSLKIVGASNGDTTATPGMAGLESCPSLSHESRSPTESALIAADSTRSHPSNTLPGFRPPLTTPPPLVTRSARPVHSHPWNNPTSNGELVIGRFPTPYHGHFPVYRQPYPTHGPQNWPLPSLPPLPDISRHTAPFSYFPFPPPFPQPRPLPYYSPPRPPMYRPVYPTENPKTEIRKKLTKQLDYYFSADNLCKDDFLRRLMDVEGWVPVTQIMAFHRVAQLTSDRELVLEAARASGVIQVQGDKMRRLGDWMKWPSLAHLPHDLFPSHRRFKAMNLSGGADSNVEGTAETVDGASGAGDIVENGGRVSGGGGTGKNGGGVFDGECTVENGKSASDGEGETEDGGRASGGEGATENGGTVTWGGGVAQNGSVAFGGGGTAEN